MLPFERQKLQVMSAPKFNSLHSFSFHRFHYLGGLCKVGCRDLLALSIAWTSRAQKGVCTKETEGMCQLVQHSTWKCTLYLDTSKILLEAKI